MRFISIITMALIGGCGGAGQSGSVTSDTSEAPDTAALADAGTDSADADCSCDGLECGANACGEICGTCPQAARHCSGGVCFVDCQPDCDGAACGPDGCGGWCGSCGPNEGCVDHQCVCTPSCTDRECGDDHCGGVCGTCPQAAPLCINHLCLISCTADCTGHDCGDDGCGGSCGTCDGADACVAGVCTDCDCGDAVCGLGPCGTSCGTCPAATPGCLGGTCHANSTCPTAVVAIAEGAEVIPQTVLHLDGTQSSALASTVASYAWEVTAPPGSVSKFVPNSHAASPTFEANVAGTYVFRLTVTDSSAMTSCTPAETTVHVIPDEVIHVEVLWATPGDPDQSDEGPVAGSDMDLHFAHQFATGGYDGDGDGKADGWFDGQFDCFWFNHHPNWGSLDPAIDDDPGLDREDADGAGPEIVNLNTVENGLTYKIGVHNWNDHSYGPSFVKVRVFVFGSEVFDATANLGNHDMWTVATLDWPAGTVTAAQVCAGTTTPCTSNSDCTNGGCSERIARGYAHPFFPYN